MAHTQGVTDPYYSWAPGAFRPERHTSQRASILELCCTIDNAYQNGHLKSYKNVKYNNHVYVVGDLVEVVNFCGTEGVPHIGKILKILEIGLSSESQQQHLYIEVIWYYRKNDLPSLTVEPLKKIFSSKELFATKQRGLKRVSDLISCIHLLDAESYRKTDIQSGVYFTRASYDIQKRVFDPPTDRWATSCVLCSLPWNPDEEQVFCGLCNKSVHVACLNEGYRLPYICRDCA